MVAAIALRVHGVAPSTWDYLQTPPEGCDLLSGVGNVPRIGDPGLARRAEIFIRYAARMRNIVDPSAIILGLAEGDIFPGAIVNAGARIARNAIINTGAIIEHDCIVGAHSHVAPGALLCGDVRVGERTHVGARSVIKQGVRIGNDCLIGMGAVVRIDLPDGATLLRDGHIISRAEALASKSKQGPA